MKRMIRASYNGDSGKYFLDIPESIRHNGKKRWRIESPFGEEFVVSWRQNHYDAISIQPHYHRTKGYEMGFDSEKLRLTDNDLIYYKLITEMP